MSEVRHVEQPADQLEALLRDRHSCRAFTPEPVDDEVIDRLFTIAQRAPSWCNTQPWEVHVTRGAGTERFRTALVEHVTQGAGSDPDYDMPAGYTGVHRARRRESGWQLYEAVGVARGDRDASARQSFRNYELFGAPHVAIVTTVREQQVYGAVDAGIYVGTLLLAAQSLGLGAIPQAAIARLAPFVRDHFGIDDSRGILLAVSFGHPDQAHPANSYRTSRVPTAEVVAFHD